MKNFGIKKVSRLKKLFISPIAILPIVFFTACGGSGGSFSNSNIKVSVVSCSGAVSTWTTISSGDVVIGSSGAVLMFDHDSSNNKKVCVSSGTAYVTSS